VYCANTDDLGPRTQVSQFSLVTNRNSEVRRLTVQSLLTLSVPVKNCKNSPKHYYAFLRIFTHFKTASYEFSNYICFRSCVSVESYVLFCLCVDRSVASRSRLGSATGHVPCSQSQNKRTWLVTVTLSYSDAEVVGDVTELTYEEEPSLIDETNV